MADPMYVAIGAALRRRRDELGMTQAALARHLGLSRTSVTNIECGRQPMLVHQLLQASDALRIDPNDILKAASLKPNASRDQVPADFDAAFAKLRPRRMGT